MQTNFDVLAELPAELRRPGRLRPGRRPPGRGKVVQSTGVLVCRSGHRPARAPLARPPPGHHAGALVGDRRGREGDQPRLARGRRGGPRWLPAVQPARRDGQAGSPATRAPGPRRAPRRSSTRRSTRAWTTATEYLALLGDAFPDVAASTGVPRCDDGPRVRARQGPPGARQRGGLDAAPRSCRRTLTSPTAAGGAADGASVGLMGDYLDELGVAFPAAREAAAFRSARAAATRLEKKVSIATALDLSSGLSDLATWFEANDPGVHPRPAEPGRDDRGEAASGGDGGDVRAARDRAERRSRRRSRPDRTTCSCRSA